MVPNELFQIKCLGTREIAVYAYLKYRAYCGNGIKTFPTQKRIMRDLNIGSDNTLRKAILALTDNDFLNVIRGSSFKGSSMYTLTKPEHIYEKNA
jgi:hypothetical protein